ncbi:MAG: hypothetical protein IH585_14170 [Anaerolineaceae bacterium]|nr:hypothetical protein [Anaerolineaceae bacterium]
MSNKIEVFDLKRIRFLKWQIIGVMLFLIISISEMILKFSGIPIRDIRWISLPLLIISVLLQAIFVMKLAFLQKKIDKDMELKQALDNELVNLNRMKAWRTGFIILALFTGVFGVLSIFFPVDPVYAALTSIVAGAGGYNLGFFVLESSASK